MNCLPVNDLARLAWPGPVGVFARLGLACPVGIGSIMGLIPNLVSNSQPGRSGNLAKVPFQKWQEAMTLASYQGHTPRLERLPGCPVDTGCPVGPIGTVALLARLQLLPGCPVDNVARLEILLCPVGTVARLAILPGCKSHLALLPAMYVSISIISKYACMGRGSCLIRGESTDKCRSQGTDGHG